MIVNTAARLWREQLAGRLLAGRDGPTFLRVDEQETTDSEKALLFAVDQGCTEAVLLGAVGRRLDHTLYNASLVKADLSGAELFQADLSGAKCDAQVALPEEYTCNNGLAEKK